ncbi:response regulator [Cohnella endophytica]|uniref:Response regulator n=1 Tax=Cohnella endophytica TaxID=2419778 RepID=A0A494Y591_9BACL|nr:response regulator [Cohnella endophytica]RKP57240.1 response regulator [Cohnella endophytica]
MYKLLIVDDEALVREAIKEQMDWAKLGFECVGDCEDGLEALEFIRRETPDVVLTDIGMPFMDGLELTRELAAHYPDVKVIILTGYDDFDFAQQALKLQAVDYVLKPITAAELETILKKLASELDLVRSRAQDHEKLKRQLTESLPLLKERFLERLVTSPMTERQIKESCEYFELRWKGPFLIELAADVDKWELQAPSTLFDRELIRFGLYNIAQEIAGKYEGSESFRDRENRVLVLLSGEEENELQERAIQLAEQLHEAATSYLPIQLSIGIGHACRWSDNAPLAHRSAMSALEYSYVIGSNAVIPISDMESRERPELLSVVGWDGELITKLKTGTPQEMEDWVTRLFSSFREHVFPFGVCTIYLQRLAVTMMHALYEMNYDSAQVFGESTNLVTELGRFGSLDEIEDWMKEACVKAVTVIRGKREDQTLGQITKAIEYVKRNYMDPELSLKTVCRHVSMSGSYFSSIFKQHNGRSFVEYVTHERMEKARELLSLTGMKSYEVAYAVGYSDPHYFSGAFKKHFGETPMDYRNKTMTWKA